MLAVRVLRHQATEVADALHPRLRRRPGEIGRRLQVQAAKGLARSHGMDQVIGDTDPGQGRRQGRRVQGIRADDLHPGPAPCRQGLGLTGGDAHPRPGGDEARDQIGADIATGPEDEAQPGVPGQGSGRYGGGRVSQDGRGLAWPYLVRGGPGLERTQRWCHRNLLGNRVSVGDRCSHIQGVHWGSCPRGRALAVVLAEVLAEALAGAVAGWAEP